MTGTDERFEGKSIPRSEFAGDTGDADPAVIDVLVGYAANEAAQDQRTGTVTRWQVLDALANSRVFVPVTAFLDSVETQADGHEVEKDSHMATVSMQTPDGRRGLLAFTSTTALSEWDGAARPVAAWLRQAAAAAIDEGADALLIDVNQSYRFVVSRSELAALQSGDSMIPAAADPAVREALVGLLQPISGEFGCQFELAEPSGDAALRLNVIVGAGVDPTPVLQEVASALPANNYLARRLVGGVELGTVTV